MSHYQDLVKQSQELLAQLNSALNESNIDQLKLKYLGKKGLFNQLASQIKTLKNQEKKDFGQILNQLKANILNKPIVTLDINEAGCMGAAMLSKAAFTKQDVSEIAKKWVRPVSKIEPLNYDLYDEKFKNYKTLYSDLKKYDSL